MIIHLHPTQAFKEVSMICSDILGEIIKTAVKDSSETVDQVCNSIMDILTWTSLTWTALASTQTQSSVSSLPRSSNWKSVMS